LHQSEFGGAIEPARRAIRIVERFRNGSAAGMRLQRRKSAAP
jgi:hypothetical protein